MNDNLTTSAEGLQLIKNFEGFRSRPYICPAGKPTVGYGRVISQEEWDHYMKNPITEEEASQDLIDLLNIRFEPALKRMVKVKLTQHQFDALISFIYNLGEAALKSSTLLKLLNLGQYDSASKQFLRWNKAKDPKTGKLIPLAGLTKRRVAEETLFEKK